MLNHESELRVPKKRKACWSAGDASAIVRDAVETKSRDSRKTLEELVSMGAALVSIDEILARCQFLSA